MGAIASASEGAISVAPKDAGSVFVVGSLHGDS
jgi:hypothetical protein